MLEIVLDPNVAYFLLVAGLVMAVLALFTPGTGLLEIGAFFALLLAGWGIINLEINLWALAILVVGVIPFVLAVRRSHQWYWMLVAIAALLVGSIFLFDSEGGLAVNPFFASLTSLIAAAIMWVVGKKGLEAMLLRPTNDLSRLIGQVGEARTNVFLEGTVYLDGEEWTARSGVMIPVGSQVVVVSREGLTLIVEPVSVRQG